MRAYSRAFCCRSGSSSSRVTDMKQFQSIEKLDEANFVHIRTGRRFVYIIACVWDDCKCGGCAHTSPLPAERHCRFLLPYGTLPSSSCKVTAIFALRSFFLLFCHGHTSFVSKLNIIVTKAELKYNEVQQYRTNRLTGDIRVGAHASKNLLLLCARR